MDQRRTDTREQIQAVALRLFVERGYDGASLREIAECLGVTKAALYYHFQSKEQILTSLIEDFLGQLDALVHWAQDQPRTPAARVEVLRRYSELLTGRTAELARFMHEGRSGIRELSLAAKIRAHFVALIDLLVPPGNTLAGRMRAQIALMTLHAGTFRDPDLDLGADETERREAALSIAIEILFPSSERHPYSENLTPGSGGQCPEG